MNFLDRLAFNRLVAIVLNFIVAIIKIFAPSAGKELEKNCPVIPPLPKPPLKNRRKIIPRKQEENDE
jgi:hypothetical protein